ncbi:MAG: penicillin acylase family protein [Candidatus Electryonea clarkiae]|nr:penicillin acylase family protein [Candidatus Electryonea clarkiae]MDP8287416.1 penicillin acylase family protein [Candidatus Electryonea clarkiae]
MKNAIISFRLAFIISIIISFNQNNSFALTLSALDGTEAEIFRDNYGVPHITAETEVGLFFAQGFAIAQDKMFRMDKWRRAGEGKQAEWYGEDYIEIDRFRRIIGYSNEERTTMFEQMSDDTQEILESYVAGINTYMDSCRTNPEIYQPIQYEDYPLETWTVENSIAVAEWMAHAFCEGGGEELERLAELQEHGEDWFNENRPINDPDSPTTIRDGVQAQQPDWNYSGLHVNPEVIQRWIEQKRLLQWLRDQLGLPRKFGSFTVLVSVDKSNSGETMLIGAPQMGEPHYDYPNTACEVELTSPTIHAGGLSLPGIPGVIAGRTEHFAWTITSGISDNCDVYIDSTQDNSFSRYWYNGQWRNFEVIEDTIRVSDGTTIPLTHYRTVHGPVFEQDLDAYQVFSLKMVLWKREIEFVETFININRAQNAQEYESAIENAPLSFNLFYSGDDGTMKYWHIGQYQDRSDGVDPRLPHKGDGSEEWGDFIPFNELPQADGDDQDYFVNWNNKPVSWWNNGDNVRWVGEHQVTRIDNYISPIEEITFENLGNLPATIRSRGNYTQVIEWTDPVADVNLCPPGQNDFISIAGDSSEHMTDQWELNLVYGYKNWLFGDELKVKDQNNQLPNGFNIKGFYPNPFNPTTSITVSLPYSAALDIRIYNILGELITDLAGGKFETGNHIFVFNAGDLPSGIYFARITAGDDFDVVRKLGLIK